MTVLKNMVKKVRIGEGVKKPRYFFICSLDIGVCWGFAIWNFLDRRLLCT